MAISQPFIAQNNTEIKQKQYILYFQINNNAVVF